MNYGPAGTREAYPAWTRERVIPLSKEDIFLDLTQKFGFRTDSMRNMVRFSASFFHVHLVRRQHNWFIPLICLKMPCLWLRWGSISWRLSAPLT